MSLERLARERWLSASAGRHCAGVRSIMLAEVGSLIGRCLDGDDQAQAEFYTRYAGLIERAIMRKIAATTGAAPLKTEVEDIRNEVFLRLLRKENSPLKRLKEPKAINAWLVTVAGNLTIDHFRKWARCQAVQGAAAELCCAVAEEPAKWAIAQERADLIERQLACLDAEDRLILELFFVQGLKYIEIAQMLGRNINTVSSRLRRTKERLRHLFIEDFHELV